jgi:alpha-galactosidase
LFGQRENLVLTPPMGWNSWNTFGCNIDQLLIMQTTDAMFTNGMKAAGYQYVILDDCWQVSRDSNGRIEADPEKFPSGINGLAVYAHSKGMKLGVYSDAGTATCQGRPGSRGYETIDAQTYAEWGVDYLKYDWCNTEGQDAFESYHKMGAALDSTGRDIVFSICEWGSNQPWLWGEEAGGNLWRTTGDINASWGSILSILDAQNGLEQYAVPGHWNDPDMLEVGNGGLTLGENRAHFSLWCILAAPLIAGNDVRNMDSEILEILTNSEVIAIDQDSLGMQGKKVKDYGDKEVWSKSLKDGSRGVALLNRGEYEANITVKWTYIGWINSIQAEVRDLWAHQDLGTYEGFFTASVPPHDVVMLRITPQGSDDPAIINEICYNSGETMNTGDWIEIYNPGTETLFLGGWRFTNDWGKEIYEFPVTALIEPGGYFILANDVDSFRSHYPGVEWVMGNFGFDLLSGMETIYLLNQSSDIIDEVEYSNVSPWDENADGTGYSLELKNPSFDNNAAENWSASSVSGGTPGEQNSNFVVSVNEEENLPGQFELFQNYPNPFGKSSLNSTSETVIRYSIPDEMNNSFVTLKVYDAVGKETAQLKNEKVSAGKHSIKFNASNLSSGTYFYRLSVHFKNKVFTKSKKMILLK